MSIASLFAWQILPQILIWLEEISKQMDIAANSRFSIIVGPQELEEGNVVLRDMINGTEGTILLKN